MREMHQPANRETPSTVIGALKRESLNYPGFAPGAAGSYWLVVGLLHMAQLNRAFAIVDFLLSKERVPRVCLHTITRLLAIDLSY